MPRLLVALLAAVDALVAAVVGLAALLAPLTVLWVLAFGVSADWGALWPTAVTLWQFGHAVPVDVVIPTEVALSLGIAADGASFSLSLPPLVFLLFTVLFAARSGRRAVEARAGTIGVVSGTLVFGGIAVLAGLTGRAPMAETPLVAALLVPMAAYAAGATAGALVTAWGAEDDRAQRMRESLGGAADIVAATIRGASAATIALVGASGVALAVAVVAGAGQMVALFESLHVDALGATIIALGQLAYLPTLLVWGVSWLAGPGFSVGAGTMVSPAGTDLGVVPGIPVFGLLPEIGSIWALVVILVPVAAGALAGWIVRSRGDSAGAELSFVHRLIVTAGIAVLTGAAAAAAGALASGSMGPGRLAQTGPEPGPLALSIGLEVLVGAAILLLSPRHREDDEALLRGIEEPAAHPERPAPSERPDQDVSETTPLDRL